MAIPNFNRIKPRLEMGMNKLIKEMLPNIAPKNNLYSLLYLFKAMFTVRSNKKSNIKLIKKIKSRYIIIISPL